MQETFSCFSELSPRHSAVVLEVGIELLKQSFVEQTLPHGLVSKTVAISNSVGFEHGFKLLVEVVKVVFVRIQNNDGAFQIIHNRE